MPEIDYAGAWVALKAKLAEEGKRSFGQDELMLAVARIELAHQVPEGQEGYSDLPPRRGESRPAHDAPPIAAVPSDGHTPPTIGQEVEHGHSNTRDRAVA